MRYTSLVLLVAFTASQCKVNKNSSSANTTQERILKEITVTPNHKAETEAYQPSETRKTDLLHTTLWVKFNYDSQEVIGKAKLTMKPYFYPITEVVLDAKEFDIHKLCLLKGDSVNLKYTYDRSKLVITLDREYKQNETFNLYIAYTAHPSKIKTPGSDAISDARGLYFINPTKKDKHKPRQIWSQGETQSNSGWFPTVDMPNEKMTQDIYLTVDQSDITLSNGLLIYSTDEPDGKRTDYWSQKLPAAPYLTMIAVGEFIKNTDSWRDSIEVSSYLEKDYAPYAQMIFGTTPEMMECFSTRLGVAYPWEKFSQIVVRDFVSGAMENTSAVVHFEPVQHTSREHIDNNWEGIIAHELFHHWFGDLVTCESWSNIPLNESFATYGEYMWNEYKYGKSFADYSFDNNLQAYLRQKNAANKQVIRYHYAAHEDMFDVVSYQKGSRILHMLRNEVGDDAFFESLKRYLTANKFKTVEIHQLRLAFEEVTGRDLNWFFNQWFLNSGHPILDITYTYNAEHNKITIQSKQLQDTLKHGVFRLPVNIDLYTNGKAERKQIVLDKTSQEFIISASGPIDFINFDPGKNLLAKVTVHQSQDEWIKQLSTSASCIDKKYSATAIIAAKNQTVSPVLADAVTKLFADTFYGNRMLALQLVRSFPEASQLQFEKQLAALSEHDAKSLVQAEAIDVLSDLAPDKYEALFTKLVDDSSYAIVGSSLEALAEIDGTKALAAAHPYLNENNLSLHMTISELIAEHAKTDYVSYFENLIPRSGRYQVVFFSAYSDYLLRQDTLIQQKAMSTLTEWYHDPSFSDKTFIPMMVEKAQKFYITQYDDATNEMKNKKLDPQKRMAVKQRQDSAFSMYNRWGLVTGEKQ
jgi:aminopeptidase N